MQKGQCTWVEVILNDKKNSRKGISETSIGSVKKYLSEQGILVRC